MISFSKLQNRGSGRLINFVFYSRSKGLRILMLVLVLAFVLLRLFQASPSFSQSPSVVINEIMYVPSDNSPNEWIEVKNTSSSVTSLDGLKVGDAVASETSGSNGMFLFPSGNEISGGDFVVIARKADLFYNHFGFYPNFEFTSTVESVPDMSKYSSWSTGYFSLSNSGDEILLLGSSDEIIDQRSYSEGQVEKGKTYARDQDGNWKEANPTPGAENSFPKEETKEQQSQPTINFSAPSTVSVDTPFSVSVTLKNFKSGTYSLKVLIGKGERFYDGRTKGTNGEWLAWNAGWADFPKVTISSSGSGSKTVQAKTDDDVVAGSYLIKIRAYDGKNTFDSDTKNLKVTGVASKSDSSGSVGKTEGTGEFTGEVGEVTRSTGSGQDGEVKGEEAPRGEGFKLNFYTILGIFGMVVGSGGLILSFAKMRAFFSDQKKDPSK